MSADSRPAAIVTGGARGIGFEIAMTLIAKGWRVGVVDINPKAIIAAHQLEEARNGLLIPLELSIVDRAAVEAAIQAFAAQAGAIGALVNNAGMTLPATFLDQNDEDWDRIVNTNLKGTFVMSQIVARHMQKQATGAIVNISSISAHGIRTGPPAYAAAKAGVEGLSRLMAAQLGEFGIRVNTIVVGTTATAGLLSRKTDEELAQMRQSTVSGQLGDPGDIAHVAAFLCSNDAKHVTGQLVSVSGGQWMP